MANGWGDTKPVTNKDNKRLEDETDVFDFKDSKGEFVQMRFLPCITSYSQTWIPIISSKQKKNVSIPKICSDYNPETEQYEKDECPYRKSGVGRTSQTYLKRL
jgi:hypothetical protein